MPLHTSPELQHRPPGLKPGDKWCLCAMRWMQALKANVAPPVVVEATHRKTLNHIDLVTLGKHAVHETS